MCFYLENKFKFVENGRINQKILTRNQNFGDNWN